MFYIQIIWPDLTSGSGPTIPDSILFLLFLFTLFAFFLFLFPSQTTIKIRILDIVTYQLKIFSRSIRININFWFFCFFLRFWSCFWFRFTFLFGTFRKWFLRRFRSPPLRTHFTFFNHFQSEIIFSLEIHQDFDESPILCVTNSNQSTNE